MNDRRRDRRHDIVLSITVDGTPATTRDVSTTGVYFIAPRPFHAGSSIEFTLPLPRLAEADLELNCHATVVRVDAREKDCGIAARIDRYTLNPASIHGSNPPR